MASTSEWAWHKKQWLPVPVVVSRILTHLGVCYEPFRTVFENEAGVIVYFETIPVRCIMYVRADSAHIERRDLEETIELDSLDLSTIVHEDFSLGSFVQYAQQAATCLVNLIGGRSDARRCFGLYMHIEPVNDSMFPDPTLVLQWLRSTVLRLDPVDLVLVIEKRPFWHIRLHLLPGHDEAWDRCLALGASKRELARQMAGWLLDLGAPRIECPTLASLSDHSREEWTLHD